ncbi:neutrophil cytosol factor 2 [Seriola lalandi dorsalis]|uniref:neutrophil cytosol factor 2 n=1 Tax=Seriola lalandi dorsalis TaxID=1841481 RepID=UPI000C6F5CCF|nr:neutrophil cytosol factor 2 [Seriola lalandi dorsalis]
MSFVDTLRQWDEAVTYAERQDFQEALRIFLSIQEPNSKICFDIGCLHLLNQELDAAEKAFDCSIRKDEHLAVAFFQRGITFYRKKRYEESLGDFQQAFKALRGNQLIDYKALGLRCKLYACDVVASVVPQDEFSGFAPLQPQVEDGPTRPKEPEVLRALEGEPHTVLFEFVPETSDELAVVPGNIVFVLQKGTDNWASVIFNERRGLVPYNYLERLEISLASKQNEGKRTPPSREPPTRPERKQGGTPRDNSSEDTQCKEETTDNSYIVKVRFTFTFIVKVPPGSPYVILIEKISKKLNLPSTAITLSLTSEANERSVIDANTEMERVWSHVKDRHITLWCNTKEQTDGKPQTEIHLVALHSYESSNPEDLSFHEGDTITLLSRVNQDWLEGQCKGNTGIFPASFVEEVPVNGQ